MPAPLTAPDTPLIVLDTPLIVLDTNVFVAAGFNPRSASGRLVAAVANGDLCLAWNADTLAETRHILSRIPRLAWSSAEALFAAGREFPATPAGDAFAVIPDPSDRKFAALADAAGAILVSSDSDLLSVRDRLPVAVRTPKEWWAAAGMQGPG